MGEELTEEQKKERRKQWQKNWESRLTPEQREERRRKAREHWRKKHPAPSAPRPEKKKQAVLPAGPRIKLASIREIDGEIFISTGALLGAAQELRFELIYQLRGAKIVKE